MAINRYKTDGFRIRSNQKIAIVDTFSVDAKLLKEMPHDERIAV